MPVCIVSATTLELQHLPASDQYTTLITGIGPASTTYHLVRFLQQHRPSLLIQAGIAGSFDENIPLGQTVLVSHDRFADLGVIEQNQWKDIYEMQLADANIFPYTNGWLINPDQELLQSFQLHIVKSISISEITTQPARIQQVREKYAPTIESMEGAAFHYVCLQERIPFIQVRTISNYIGERDKSKWDLPLAVRNLATRVQSIIHSYNFSTHQPF